MIGLISGCGLYLCAGDRVGLYSGFERLDGWKGIGERLLVV